MSAKAMKIAITCVVLTGALGGLMYTTLAEGTEYYKHVDEVMAQRAVVARQEAAAPRLRRRICGSGPTRWTTGSRCRTTARSSRRDYTGVVPDTFKNGSEVVLKGQLHAGRLRRRAQRRDGEVPVEVRRRRPAVHRNGR